MRTFTALHQCGHEELHQCGKGKSMIIQQCWLEHEPCTKCLQLEARDACARNLRRGLPNLSGIPREAWKAEVIRNASFEAMEALAADDTEQQQRLKGWRLVTKAREWLLVNDMPAEEMLEMKKGV